MSQPKFKDHITIHDIVTKVSDGIQGNLLEWEKDGGNSWLSKFMFIQYSVSDEDSDYLDADEGKFYVCIFNEDGEETDDLGRFHNAVDAMYFCEQDVRRRFIEQFTSSSK